MKTKKRIGIPAVTGLLLAALLLGTLVFASPLSAQDESIQRGIDADSARYASLGKYYQSGIQRGIDASAARYAALGNHYQEDGIQRGIDADAARYAALGRHYAGQLMVGISQDSVLAANPELMAARRYGLTASLTAGIASLAANPELMAARRFNSTTTLVASDLHLAINPELSSVARYENCGC